VSATVAALEDAYTDTDLFEKLCQICGDELDVAGTNELVHHIHSEATPDGQPKRNQPSNWDLWLASK
jgi:hypothetical protein